MMKNKTGIFTLWSAVFAVMFASMAMTTGTAQANTGLEGKYKYAHTQCSSGAPANEHPSLGDVEVSITSDLDFTSEQLTTINHLFMKYDAVKGAATLQQIEAAIAAIKQFPNGPEKDAMLKQANDAKELILRMFAGFSCTITTQSSYTVDGSTIHTPDGTVTSDCPGDYASNPTSPATDIQFKLSGNFLILTYQATGDGFSACPAGDTITMFFERQN